MKIESVCIIGAGIMGHGIAHVTAASGIPVRLNDLSDEILSNAKTNIEKSLDKGVSRGKISREEKNDILGRIVFESDFLKAVDNADLVIEAVSENISLKKDIFGKLDKITRNNTILASNTSQYSITEIASAVSDPSRVVGMHWFNPPITMKLIEIVRGLDTSDAVVEAIRDFAVKAGKEIVVCKDSTGFISTRVLLALRLECYRLFEEGIATKEDIDKTLKLAFGHPMGQFELADFSGLDIEVPSCESLTRIFGDRFRPPQTLLCLVRAGRFGRKTGKGWYDYDC